MRLHVYIEAGYLFPSDKLVAWWNERAKGQPDAQLEPDDSGTALLSDYLWRKFGLAENGETIYNPRTLHLRTKGVSTQYVWVPIVEGDFGRVPPEEIKKCRIPEVLEREHCALLKKSVEEWGYDFKEHGVRWYNNRYVHN